MPASPPLSRKAWIKAGVFGLMGVPLAWFAFSGALAGYARERAPETALRFAPHEPSALSARADALLKASGEAGPSAEEVRRIGALALDSYRGAGLNPRALRVLGLAKDLQQDRAGAFRLIGLSDKMSRRDMLGQLWLIEYSANAGDIDAALHHYDIVLRVKPGMRELLFGRLMDAVQEPDVRSGLAKYVTASNPWIAEFISYAIRQDRTPLYVAQTIVRAGGMPQERLLQDLNQEIVRRFVERGEYAYARDYYRRVIAKGDGALTDWRFSKQATDPANGRFAWQVAATPGVNASFEDGQGSDGRVFRVLLSNVRGGVVLSKMLMLPRGSYRVAPAAPSASAPKSALPFAWRLSCLPAGKGGEVEDVTIPGNAPVAFDCDAQILELRFTDTAASGDAEFIIAAPHINKM